MTADAEDPGQTRTCGDEALLFHSEQEAGWHPSIAELCAKLVADKWRVYPSSDPALFFEVDRDEVGEPQEAAGVRLVFKSDQARPLQLEFDVPDSRDEEDMFDLEVSRLRYPPRTNFGVKYPMVSNTDRN